MTGNRGDIISLQAICVAYVLRTFFSSDSGHKQKRLLNQAFVKVCGSLADFQPANQLTHIGPIA